MNLSSTPELSLYQLAQQSEYPPQSVVVNAGVFKALIGAFIDFLIEQKLAVSVWAKFPRNERWLAEIERYQQQGRADKIYQCNTHKAASAAPPVQSLTKSSQEEHTRMHSDISCSSQSDDVQEDVMPDAGSGIWAVRSGVPITRRYAPSSKLIPLVLEAGSQLKREYFLLVLSPHFCSLILAQRQVPQATEEQSPTQSQSSQLRLIYSFEAAVIERVLAGIKQALTITDTTPDELLTDSGLAFALPSAPNGTLLNHLLLKQIQHTEAIHSSENVTQSQPNLKILEESVHLKDEFLNNLARELRLPLTNMKTALRLLESKQVKREQRERYLELLHRECDRQNSLLVGLLEFVQLDQTKPEFEPSLKLEDLVPGIVSTYQPIAEEKGIQLGYTIPAGFPPVSCPSAWLRQILLNLLHNSLKFTPANGRVFVQAALKNEYIELTVNDTGVGIDSSDFPKIFNSFYRGRNAPNQEIGGAGLGLTIVQHLLNRCGGSISVTSKLGKGSTFNVLLPINAPKDL